MTTKTKDKKLRVLHGKANHAIGESCKFCDNVKKEYEADMATKRKDKPTPMTKPVDKKYTIDNHKHDYWGYQSSNGPFCRYCGLLKSTIEANNPVDKKEEWEKEFNKKWPNTAGTFCSLKSRDSVMEFIRFLFSDQMTIKTKDKWHKAGWDDCKQEIRYIPPLIEQKKALKDWLNVEKRLAQQKQEIIKMIEGMKSVYLIKNIGIECSCKKIFNKHIVPDEGNYLLKSDILEKIKLVI